MNHGTWSGERWSVRPVRRDDPGDSHVSLLIATTLRANPTKYHLGFDNAHQLGEALIEAARVVERHEVRQRARGEE
jgi:hypothetical protein